MLFYVILWSLVECIFSSSGPDDMILLQSKSILVINTFQLVSTLEEKCGAQNKV